MVTGDAFEDAVRLARENSGLAVGIHLVTVVGRSVLPKKEIPSLVDENQNFSNRPNLSGWKYYFSLRARRDLRKELAAQFEKFRSTGLPLSHIDGHLHMHVHPVIFRAALELGERYGTKRIRVPVEELRAALQFDRSNFLQKLVFAFLFDCLGWNMKQKLKKRGFTFADRVYGNLQSGKMTEEYFLYLLNRLQAKNNEIYFHPADFPAGDGLTPDQQQGRTELKALTSPSVAERIREQSLLLCHYKDLESRT